MASTSWPRLARQRPIQRHLGAISCVLQARSGVVRCAAKPDLPGQLPEHSMDVLKQQLAAALGHKEVWAEWLLEMSIAAPRIAHQHTPRGRMRRH